jgi:predicted secreted protein
MSWTTWVGIFIVVWWLVLFTTLPFGVRNADEAGEEVVQGTETGAPVKHMIGRKILATTLIASAIVGTFYTLVALDLFDFRSYLLGT